jgi:hypothetical protein
LVKDVNAERSGAVGLYQGPALRIAGAVAVAVGIGIVSFAFRFNTLGGALGGLDNDHFIYLTRTDMVLSGEQPLRDFVDAELRGAWPALTYLVSAWAQQLGGRTLLSEAYLSVGALAVANAVVFLLALDFSKRWTMALLAVATTVAMVPKLYNYPKVLMLALGVWALHAAVASPSLLRLGAAAVATVVAVLFRHDMGLYLGVATVTALVIRDLARWPVLVRTVGTYVGLTGVLLLPSIVWVQVYEGIPLYISNSLASVAVERSRTELRLPSLDLTAPFTGESLLLVTYWVFWAVPVIAACALIGRMAVSTTSATERTNRALVAGLLVMGALVNMSFLRANLAARFGDAIVPVVLLAACTVGGASVWKSVMARRSAITLSFVLVAQMLAAAYSFGDVALELDTSGLSDSWGKTTRRYATARADLMALPPDTWPATRASAAMKAAGYIAQCTAPDDHLLVTGAIHEIPVLARRRFAAGQAMFKLSLYTSERDQQRALAKLEQQSVPIVLADARESGDGFLDDYPLLAQHLETDYRHAGTIIVEGEPGVVVFVERRREPLHVDSELGLPCFR